MQLLQDKDVTRRELDSKTQGSAQFAVLLLRDEDKAAVQAQFQTPLVLPVHEAKGLEPDAGANKAVNYPASNARPAQRV